MPMIPPFQERVNRRKLHVRRHPHRREPAHLRHPALLLQVAQRKAPMLPVEDDVVIPCDPKQLHLLRRRRIELAPERNGNYIAK